MTGTVVHTVETYYKYLYSDADLRPLFLYPKFKKHYSIPFNCGNRDGWEKDDYVNILSCIRRNESSSFRHSAWNSRALIIMNYETCQVCQLLK